MQPRSHVSELGRPAPAATADADAPIMGTIRGVTGIQTFDDRFWWLGPLVWFLAIEY